MTLVNARAAFETAILNAVRDADPTVSVIFDNTPFSSPGKNKKLITYCKKKPQKIYKNKFYLNGACSLYVIIDY